MEVILLMLVLGVAAVIACVWLAACMIGLCVRGLWWGVRAPFRAGMGVGASRRAGGDAFTAACTNGKCRAPLPAEARFCSRCGTALQAQRTADRARPVVATAARVPAFSQVA